MRTLRGLLLIPIGIFCVIVWCMTYLGLPFLVSLIAASIRGWFWQDAWAVAYAIIGWQIYATLAAATAPMLLLIDAKPHLSVRYGLWWHIKNTIDGPDWWAIAFCMIFWPIAWLRINAAYRDDGGRLAEKAYFATVHWLATFDERQEVVRT